MNTVAAILQGITQGVTEFLPISSSGHLFLIGQFLKKQAPSLSLVLILHLATLLCVFAVFNKEIFSLAKNIKKKPNQKLLFHVLISLLPLAGVGLFFRPLIQESFEKHIVGAGFLSTGLLLLSLLFARAKNRSLNEIGPKTALAIGLAQAMAALPGFSRAGWTVAIALYCGLRPRDAVYFSFLISIPAVFGSVLADGLLTLLLSSKSALHTGAGASAVGDRLSLFFPEGLASTGIAFICAFLSGIFSLWAILKMSQTQKLYLFSLWLIPLGLGVLLFL